MANVEHYTYRVFWSPEDKEFVGVCAEFPSLSHLAKKQSDALEGIRDLVVFVVADLAKAKRVIPEPLTTQDYSGNLRVRLPPNLHRSLSVEAAETGRSLNRLIIDRLLGHSYAPVRKAQVARIEASRPKPKTVSRTRRAAKARTKRDSFA